MVLSPIGRRRPWLRVSLMVVLLSMILMRLVWMQLRTYRARVDAKGYVSLVAFEQLAPLGVLNLGEIPKGLHNLQHPEMEPIKSLGSPLFRVFHAAVGSGENFNERFFIRNHQSLLMTVVFFMAIMVRIMTSSWTAALAVAAMLMSRGRLLTAVGHITLDVTLMTFFAGFFMVMAHCVRTASALSFGAVMGILCLGIQMDTSMVGLWVAMPCMLAGGYLLHVSALRYRMRRMQSVRGLYPWKILSIAVQWLLSKLLGLRTIDWSRGDRTLDTVSVRPRDRRVDYRGGRLLVTLRVPFLLWCLARKRWLSLTLGWWAVALVGLVLSLFLQVRFGSPQPLHWLFEGELFQGTSFRQWGFAGTDFMVELLDLEEPSFLSSLGTSRAVVAQSFEVPWSAWESFFSWISQWLRLQGEAFDTHLIISTLVVLVCLAQSPSRSAPGFVEVCWIVVFGSIGVLLMALASDMYDHSVLAHLKRSVPAAVDVPWKPRMVMVWLEPVILSLGLAGIYHLFQPLERTARH